jgi:hypothetical protein
MSDTERLDQVFHIIIKQMVKTGQAPHYTEIAAELGVPVEEGRKALHELFSGNYFRRRLDGDWVSRSRQYAMEMISSFKEIGKTGPFWQLSKK